MSVSWLKVTTSAFSPSRIARAWRDDPPWLMSMVTVRPVVSCQWAAKAGFSASNSSRAMS
jgi:hypothetical protein